MPSIPPYKIIIADDQTMVAEGLSAVLELYDDFKVLAIVPNGERLLHMLNSVQPDLILLDLNMPELDGFEACKLIREQYPEMVIVAVTMYDADKIRNRIKAAGANGMLLKYTSSEILVAKLRGIMAKKGADSSFVTNDEIAKVESASQIYDGDKFLLQHKISEREFEIIRMIAEGLNSDEIATKLFLSEHTVNTHRKKILEKLHLKNTAELINFMHKNMLL